MLDESCWKRPTNEDNLPQRLERACFGHESLTVNAG